MTVRTLFIGMDGATFTVLDDLTRSADGAEPVMPFLARIFKDGSRSKLRSTPNPLTPPAWVSLMTGRGPGHHGVFDFIRAEERGDEVYFTLYDARDCRVETIWSIASRQGKRVAALNFPFTAPPPQDLNGFIVPGFVPWRHLRRNSYPDDLYERLKTIPDFNPQELAWDFEQEKQSGTELSDKDREEWVSYHLPRERQWFKVAEHLMREEAPDLMAVLFDGVDKLQHQAWPYVDPRLQGDNLGGFHQRMRELSLGYFRQLDGFIEQLVTAAGPDVQVFFASDHGFTASTEVVRINAYLAEKGYVHFKDLPEGDAYDTLGGLVMAELRRLPCPGDRLTVALDGASGHAELEVVSVARRVAEKIRIRTAAAPAPSGRPEISDPPCAAAPSPDAEEVSWTR